MRNNAEGMREQIRNAIINVVEESRAESGLAGLGGISLSEINLLTDDIVRAGPARDEYHTMEELYKYRMVYNAWAVKGWLFSGYRVEKSKKHHTGELCFGGEYFIVVAYLPTGQVSNHYKLEHWDLFHCPEVEFPPEWDGHTPEVALNRMIDELKR